MTVAGQVIVLPNVPQGACPQCGSRVYKASVLASLDLTMAGLG